MNLATVQRNAHYALAAIRGVNGLAALLAPRQLARRVGVDSSTSPGIEYFERMFGIRTVLLALDLVTGDPVRTERAVRIARVVHGSDTIGAALAGVRGNLTRRAAVMTTLISLVNFALAMLARPPERPSRRFRRWARKLNPLSR